MECPLCHKKMREGAIPVMGEQLRWCPRMENGYIDEARSENCVPLSKTALFRFEAFETPSWYCEGCRMVVTPVPEIEDPMDKIKRKWNDFTEKMGEKRAAAEERREERQREKRNEERRMKDPWEVE